MLKVRVFIILPVSADADEITSRANCKAQTVGLLR